jgi:hypothetical protein
MMGAFWGGFLGAMAGLIALFILSAFSNNNDNDWSNKG